MSLSTKLIRTLFAYNLMYLYTFSKPIHAINSVLDRAFCTKLLLLVTQQQSFIFYFIFFIYLTDYINTPLQIIHFLLLVQLWLSPWYKNGLSICYLYINYIHNYLFIVCDSKRLNDFVIVFKPPESHSKLPLVPAHPFSC